MYSKTSQVKKRKEKISTVKNRLWKLCKQIIRERDDYTCQWCRKKLESKKCQTSHVIPRANGNALYFDLQNLKVLCFYCHKHKWHANPIEAESWFEAKFPDRYEYLMKRSHDSVDWKLEDFLELEKKYTALLTHV